MKNKYAIVIHGGAGTILKENMADGEEQAILNVLRNIVISGQKDLQAGVSALDVVQKAVTTLENNPFFNAGKGAVYTSTGTHELDAAIMDGKTGKAGAVAGIRYSPNPIEVARAVMDKSDHVFLGGQGAEVFAKECGLPQVENQFFDTDKRYKQWQKAKTKGGLALESDEDLSDKKFGTVGAVALDLEGNLAAATSTGGITNKLYGRIGDSPVIGSGTYANNQTCAISATGHGEKFIQKVVGYDIHARMAYQNQSLAEATDIVVMKELVEIDGSGGVIAIDKDGYIAMPFNSKGMYRAFASEHDAPKSAIFGDE